MKESSYRTSVFDKEHRHFGGKIYPSDFNADYKRKENRNGSPIASRIESDFRWENKTLTEKQNERW